MGKLAIEKAKDHQMRGARYLKYLPLSSPAHPSCHQVQHLLRFIRDHAPTDALRPAPQLRGRSNLRITFHISRLITLLFCLSLSIGNLAAQDEPAPPADENRSETTPAETPAETPPETLSTPDTPEKASTERLDPEQMTPEKGMLIGDGDSMAMVNNFVHIHGNGLIKFEDVVLYADHIWADFNENIMRASGNVRLIVGNEKTFADELIYNLETKKGIVRNGYTYNDPWYYRGTEIFKVEAEESYVRSGSLTTCSLKYPHYYFTASQIVVRIDKELIARNIVLKVGGIPLFYFPVYRRDLRKDKVAKIIVKVGTDSYQGQFLSIILPLVRRNRYNAALLYDQSTRRGSGYGFDSRYRVNDAKYQEIIVPIPPNPTPTIRAKLEEKAEELSDRLEGEYDKYKLRQIFLPYKINDADIEKARQEVDELYQQLQTEDADFIQLAQSQSDHQETRYQGGNMGFLVRGEHDKDGKRRLEPVLEESVFQLQQGALSEILRTELTFHILKVDRVLDVYGEREIQVRRIGIDIEPSTETRDAVRKTAETFQERAVAGESFEQLAAENQAAEVSEVNNGEGIPLNEMDSRWRYSVRRLEKPGDTTIPVFTDRGVYIFQMIEKEPTPTFEEVARQFELEWAETLKNEIWDTKEQDDGMEEMEDETDAGTELEGTPKENQTESADIGDENEEGDEEAEKEIKVYEKHGYRGSWESPSAVAGQTRRLIRGEVSRVLKTRTGHRIIKIDKKRTYRGDFLLLAQDQYSFNRQNAFKTGQRWTMRWGHNQSVYTPWDNPTKGRRPVSVIGRVEWQARLFKEGLGTSESTVDSFALFTWGSSVSADDTEDKDRDGNLKFSTKTVGDFLSRLQVSHSLDLEGEGTSRLQKLPEFTMSLSRMRMDGLPFFKTVNAGLVKVSDKFHTDLPILSLFRIPTLRGSSFDLDVALSNLFRKNYRDYQRNRDEQDVFLQTMDLGFDVRKQSTLQLTHNRELRVDLDFGTDVIWHDRDQMGNRNIIRGVYDVRMSAHNTLFRIYDISFIPGARRMRHQIDSTLIFNFQPPVNRDENLYPFGGSTYFYEQKRLNYTFRSSIEIKTRRNKSPHRIFDFKTRVGVDFTEDDPERSSFSRRRKYDLIDSDLTFTPLQSRNMNLTMRATHDPNPDEDDGKRFKMVGFRSNISYRRKLWDISTGSSYSNIYSASRRINASWRYRPNQRLEFNFRVIYDWIEKQFYSQSLTLRRNLHDWNMTLSWHRIGIKRTSAVAFGGGVRQDFTFQINLIAEPAASVGLGYDATTDTWGFRSLPAGVPYNAFSAGNTLGRSYF